MDWGPGLCGGKGLFCFICAPAPLWQMALKVFIRGGDEQGLWVVGAVNLVGICMGWGAVGRVLGRRGSMDDEVYG